MQGGITGDAGGTHPPKMRRRGGVGDCLGGVVKE